MERFFIFMTALFFFIFAGCGSSKEMVNDADGYQDDPADESGFDTDEDNVQDADQNEDADADVDEEFSFNIQRVFDDVAWLSNADRTGRAPGTQGNIDAIEYVKDLFDELGLTPAGDEGKFLQAFDFDQWEINGTPSFGVDGTSFAYDETFQVLQYSGGGEIDAEIVFAGHGITVPAFDKDTYPDCPLPETGYDDFEGLDVSGKIVLVLRHGPGDLESVHTSCPANEACAGEPCLWNFGYKSKNAAIHGAAGVILVNHFQDSMDIPEGGNTLGAEYFVENVPVVFASRSSIVTKVPDLESWSQSIDADLLPHSTLTGVNASISVNVEMKKVSADNVIGILPGTDPVLKNEVVVIGAHIDHLGTDPVTGEIYYGADDNASGTAVVMELARAFALSGQKTARTLLFAAWNAEELGLIGSCYHVQNPAMPMADTVAAYSIDMVGAGTGLGLSMYGATLSENAWLADVMKGYAYEQELGYEIASAEPLDASDHVCFYYYGNVPAVLLSTLGGHEYYHTPQDSIDTILMEDLKAAVMLSWAGIYPVAMGIEDDYSANEAADPAVLRNMNEYTGSIRREHNK